MFTNQDIVVIAFKLINFAALLGVGFFLFKKYVLPDLLLSIARKKNKHDSLFLQQTHLEKQQLSLDSLLKEDAAQCEKFRSNIDEWKKVVAQHHNSLEKKQANTLFLVHKRMEQNALLREQHRVQKIVTHAVVERLEKSLSDHFQTPEHNSQYLDAIIEFMNERVS